MEITLGTMQALGLIAYLLASLVAAGVLTLFFALFRKVEKNDDFKSWRLLSVLAVICAAAPYAYVEVLTRMHERDIDKAITAALKKAKVDGELSYYKVKAANDQTADIIVVAREKTTLTDNESCVMKMQLVNDPKKGWKVGEYEFVNSFKRSKDAVTFPPYW